jgi:hypothetical protein
VANGEEEEEREREANVTAIVGRTLTGSESSKLETVTRVGSLHEGADARTRVHIPAAASLAPLGSTPPFSYRDTARELDECQARDVEEGAGAEAEEEGEEEHSGAQV